MIARAARVLIARAPLLRAAVKSPLGQLLVQTQRGARVVRQPLRFLAGQLGSGGAAHYSLRASGMTVFLRHRTRDVNILNEIFGGTGGQKSYEPPPALARRLALRAPLRVLDLGANIGLFGAYALARWPGSNIHSFEPDPSNLRLLERLIGANGVEQRWSVTAAAVANESGEMSFAAGLLADSHLQPARARTAALAGDGHEDGDWTDTGEREGGSSAMTVPTVDLFAEDHDVDLMKMDIEGGEWSILGDARLATLRANVLVLEWHARGCPELDAHATALALLVEAGYSGIEEVERGEDNGLLWAWRSGAPSRAEDAVAKRAAVSP